MTNAFILCDLVWKVQKSHAANIEGEALIKSTCWPMYCNSECFTFWLTVNLMFCSVLTRDLQSNWVHILCLNSIWLTLFLQKTIGLSLSHLVPEILGPKVGLMFYQTVLFNILHKFSLCHFRSILPPFSLILDLFDPSKIG